MGGSLPARRPGSGPDGTETLEILANGMTNFVNSGSIRRVDGATTAIAQAASGGHDPIDNVRTQYTLAMAGGGSLLCSILAFTLWRQLSHAKTNFERDTQLETLIDSVPNVTHGTESRPHRHGRPPAGCTMEITRPRSRALQEAGRAGTGAGSCVDPRPADRTSVCVRPDQESRVCMKIRPDEVPVPMSATTMARLEPLLTKRVSTFTVPMLFVAARTDAGDPLAELTIVIDDDEVILLPSSWGRSLKATTA